MVYTVHSISAIHCVPVLNASVVVYTVHSISAIHCVPVLNASVVVYTVHSISAIHCVPVLVLVLWCTLYTVLVQCTSIKC